MPSFFDRVAARLGYVKPTTKGSQRRYEAAVVDRLTASWRAEGVSIDRDLRNDLDRLRFRSRDLFKNNEYAKKFGRMCGTNIVGQGFVLQSRPMEDRSRVDQRAADAIEMAWRDFGRPQNCDVRGKASFAMQCRLAVMAAARDGEGLIRIVSSGKFGLQLQMIDIDKLDTTYNEVRRGNRNQVKLGIEVDEFDRPLAYHLFTSHPHGDGDMGRTRERIPARDILHFFLPEELEQTRGIPWMHAAMRRLNDLGGYREAAVIAARIGASKMGFYQPPDGDLNPAADGLTTGSDGSEELMSQAQPGEFGRLPPGWTFQTFDPAYPHEQFDAFNKACLRGIASAMGVSYNSLANDLEGVNFSSMRSGVLEERENWMVLQDWFLEAVVEPIFARWIESSLLAGVIVQFGGSALPATKLDKFAAHTFQGRRWGWVDPTKDVQASILAIEAGLTTVTDVAAKNGVDYQDVLATKQREQELRKAYGIAEPSLSTAKPQPTDPQNQVVEDAPLSGREFAELMRAAQSASRQEPQVINVAAPTINVTTPDIRVENHVQAAPMPDVIVNVEAAEQLPPVVNVTSPETVVNVEALMPAQAAPTVNIVNEPARVEVVLPARKTDTKITRDSSGNIVSATQIEEDA